MPVSSFVINFYKVPVYDPLPDPETDAPDLGDFAGFPIKAAVFCVKSESNHINGYEIVLDIETMVDAISKNYGVSTESITVAYENGHLMFEVSEWS